MTWLTLLLAVLGLWALAAFAVGTVVGRAINARGAWPEETLRVEAEPVLRRAA